VLPKNGASVPKNVQVSFQKKGAETVVIASEKVLPDQGLREKLHENARKRLL
jgi:hypothetical protein